MEVSLTAHHVPPAKTSGRQRWAVLAESNSQLADAGSAAAAVLGQEPVLVMAASDAARGIPQYRAALRRRGVTGVALFSNDAARRAYATPYELLLALAPAGERRIIDAGHPGEQLPVRGAGLLAARCALDAATATAKVLRELLPRGTGRQHERRTGRPPESRWILALWRDAGEARVGGAVSHVSGILGGFRELGWQVALVSNGKPPEQLRRAVDALEVTAPLPRGVRFTRESAWIAANDETRRAALALAGRMPPAFVYQRNAFLSRAGADVSRQLGVPLVLEWNASAVWENRNWYRQRPLSGLFQLIGDRNERYSVRSATVVAAVSRAAAAMAAEKGAAPGQVAVVANAVDTAAIPAPAPLPVREGALAGWIGSFGRWHGVEVVIESLRHLPRHVDLVLIGDGQGRPACERLAHRLGVDQRITWIGSLPRAEALRVLARCDVLVSPHRWAETGPFFGSPTKLFEYMALGRPIVASRLEQIGQILRDGVTAVLTQPGDPADLARGITRVLAMPDRGAALGSTARREALAEHTWGRRAEQILARLPLPAARTAERSG